MSLPSLLVGDSCGNREGISQGTSDISGGSASTGGCP